MSIEQMRVQLLKWNPRWRKETVNKWGSKQICAIYTKELDKQIKKQKQNKKFGEQLSFL